MVRKSITQKRETLILGCLGAHGLKRCYPLHPSGAVSESGPAVAPRVAQPAQQPAGRPVELRVEQQAEQQAEQLEGSGPAELGPLQD